MRVTADDVAAAAGVSRAMVSRAFTPGASISARRRAQVLAVAETLGYRPNLIARGLTGARTGLIALVVGEVGRPYESWLLEHLGAAVRSQGCWPLLLPVRPGDEADAALDHALAYQVDGAIVAAGSISRALAERCRGSGAPVVMVGRILADGPDGAPGADAVCCDNAAGMAALAELLVERGRRRIAWIGGTAETFSDIERHAGLTAALARHGLRPLAERRGDYSVDSGMAQALALLTAHDRPDAIVCGNDAMALGAVSAAMRLGMAVPGDVAIAGFDDVPAAAWEPYSLTTVRNPVEDTAAEALRLLRARIDGAAGPARTVRLAPQLVVRRSA
ncbi:MAG: LacI family DNA-binding transcriptional regulator [Rubrimonas sp.]